MYSAGHSPSEIQTHLYLSFIKGHTADVSLHTKGATWEAVYQLHRVVLIQAGFFRSLFTAGFLESNPKSIPPLDQVNVSFDDLNITRSAFEICIARLYGGGPQLYLSPSLVPTPTSPLTPSFSSLAPITHPPLDHHPATPRFLLSLLATSIYLSIPSITSHALSLVLSSVGPHTVTRYLKFATGLGIGPSEGNDPEAAVGLEQVGKEVSTRDHILLDTGEYDDSDDSDVTRKLSCLDFEESVHRVDGPSHGAEEPAFNYGGIGDKVGEACACWLTRWGADILPYEENAASQVIPTSEPSTFLRTESAPSQRRASVPTTSLQSSQFSAPRLWARGGLSALWVSGLISSNDFFIKDEWERYHFAKRVVDLRRRDGLDVDEEKEWVQLFHRGIHYSNMSFDELMRISQDTSSVTRRPLVPIEVIHSTHWAGSLLRHRIVTQSSVSGTVTNSPPSSRDKDLGITFSTAEILSMLSSENTSDSDRSKPYFPVPVDSSQRIGDTDGAFATASASADQLLGNAADLSGQGHTIPRQSNLFGILSQHYTAASCIQADATGKARWSPYPPFRFAVEFWGVGQLLEKSRLHSHTIWYAGSLFNVYVQVVRKKGIQLGLYLHRQSSVDPIPRASAPPAQISTRAERLLNSSPSPRSPPDPPHTQPQTPAREHTSVGSSSSLSSVAYAVPGSPRLVPSSPTVTHFPPSTMSPTNPTTSLHAMPLQPYRDPRPLISAHFTISCASATGSSLTRFSSSPDQFSISQSWGWKSSSLRTEEYMEPNEEANRRDTNREASLRATAVLGLV